MIKIIKNMESQKIRLHLGINICIRNVSIVHENDIAKNRSRLLKIWNHRKYDYIGHE